MVPFGFHRYRGRMVECGRVGESMLLLLIRMVNGSIVREWDRWMMMMVMRRWSHVWWVVHILPYMYICIYIYIYIVYIPGYLVYRSFRVFSGDGSIRVDGTITFELFILYLLSERE